MVSQDSKPFDPCRGAGSQALISFPESPVGVFDSGVGGFTVVKEMRKRLPLESILYFGDTGRQPYGTKPQSLVREFSLQISEFLHARGAKALVIACNTATAAGLKAVKRNFPGTVLGVIEPGTRAAFGAAGAFGTLGLMATQGTVDSGVYDRELTHLGLKTTLVKQACPDFVSLVEGGLGDIRAIRKTVKKYVKTFHDFPVQALILGCTHFPLLAGHIQKKLPEVLLIDPAVQTVGALHAELKRKDLLAGDSSPPKYTFYCSGDLASFQRNVNLFLGSVIPEQARIKHVPWS